MIVTWRGKSRNRIEGKPKFWNSVRWLREEGKSDKEIREIMRKRFIARLNKAKVHGKKRRGRRAGMMWRLKQVL